MEPNVTSQNSKIKVTLDPELQKKLAPLGSYTNPMSAAEATAFVHKQQQTWQPETEPPPVPKAAGPGGACSHGYLASGSFCTPSSGAAVVSDETGKWRKVIRPVNIKAE
jgi:hypothetical protein